MRRTLKVSFYDFWGLPFYDSCMKIRKIEKFIVPAAFLFCAVGCARLSDDAVCPEGDKSSVASSKIICRSSQAGNGRLVIYVSEAMADSLGSRSADLPGKVFGEIGATLVRRVFPPVERTEKRTREYGMHRWYEVEFPESADVDDVALSLAKSPDIVKVQYCVPMKKASDGIVMPYSGPAGPMVSAAGNVSFNDPMLASQWHYINSGSKNISPTAVAGADINVADAWGLTVGDPSVIVAVVDEGVCFSHPDLAANMWTNEAEKGNDEDKNGYAGDYHGYNFVHDGPLSPGSHGTHVAGTIAAVNGNGTGVCGIAGGSGKGDGVKIMSCQIFNGEESSTPAACARAIKYAADNGACILQCSYGYPAGVFTSDRDYLNQRYYSVEYDAIRYFMEADNLPEVMDGNLVIFAAGNDSAPIASYPGACGDIISVTSIASDNLPAYYTNYGPGCNIAAPGGEYYTGGEIRETAAVLSTIPPGKEGSYGWMQGTSMACPHVSGIAALGLSYAKKLGLHFSHEEMVSMILTSVDAIDHRLSGTKTTNVGTGQYLVWGDLDLRPYKGKMGTGTINAWKLLMQIEGVPCHQIISGEESAISLTGYFGTDAKNMTFTGVSMTGAGRSSLGLEKDPYVSAGRLFISPTKAGAAKITVKAIAGGSVLGGLETGGLEISKEISVIARPFAGVTDGWL